MVGRDSAPAGCARQALYTGARQGAAFRCRSQPGVFLSCASQDVDTARRICEALRNAGLEVWFDPSELRGGDVWDQKFRRQIRTLVIGAAAAKSRSCHERMKPRPM